MVNYFYQCLGFKLERGSEEVTTALMLVLSIDCNNDDSVR